LFRRRGLLSIRFRIELLLFELSQIRSDQFPIQDRYASFQQSPTSASRTEFVSR
jgi:hypothetical protein